MQNAIGGTHYVNDVSYLLGMQTELYERIISNYAESGKKIGHKLFSRDFLPTTSKETVDKRKT